MFRDYNDLSARIDDPDLPVTADSVIVLQHAGPLGGPGMPEWGMLPIPKKLLQAGVRDMVRISDARMSGTAYGTCVLHVAPESFVGGPLAFVRDGDLIELNVPERRLTWEFGTEPIATARWASAGCHALAWAIFGAGYVAAIVFVSTVLAAAAGDVLLALAAGSRLSFYVGATVGEIGFLRCVWMDSSRRLARLEDYAASLVAAADRPSPSRLVRGIRVDGVSIENPGPTRRVRDARSFIEPCFAIHVSM